MVLIWPLVWIGEVEESLSSAGGIRIYLETSVIGGYHLGRGSVLKVTRSFFDTCLREGFELFSSDVSLREIDFAGSCS